MINNILRGFFYFVVLVLIQVLVLNNIHFLRVATPFLYLYFILKMPVGTSRTNVVFFSFLIGLVIDIFSNTPGMHAAACTFAGFIREPLIRLFMGKDLPEGIYPSYKTFGYGGFFRYTLLFVVIHHVTLFLIESLTFFDPLFLALRIGASVVTTILLICTIEAFNIESQKSGE
ncbi:rod shape-determining protein MreD [Parabacteroides acidifaciens]|jgi:rod shape-determining protein MreD|uniref:Rod shape-determining protein MreD n=1 Tax=Parabacteroides acidifaciens TaxID=2290935 RepID=A0A3D8HD34_9BACT|nr:MULTISPECIES: rod shape-determining protein MreD [Parabacteroides]MBC8602380.1 rod shape-determining protein MreD [Parabacteroides acidifaciens]RDU48893.1 rod shape-determining protein MreD [Parabacteroides acidifaciens]RHO74632.1 rod shape-determining protein MreD [Parabacteroides sp. AF48-14]RHR55389.1 rod shape-determining protein MreD [Parabacteroides sp. AF17-28]